jgi:nitroreductase
MKADATTSPASIDVLETVLAGRFSCRAFTGERVAPATLRRLFAAAQRTPSWCNSQAWQIELLGGDDVAAFSARLMKDAVAGRETPDIPGPSRYEGVYAERRRTCGMALYDALGIARDDRKSRFDQLLENFRFFGAPHVAVISSPAELGAYGVMDCGAYVANLLNLAQALGLGAIAQGAIGMYAGAVREHLGIPETRNIVCGVSIGYADLDHPANSFRTEREQIEHAVASLPE